MFYISSVELFQGFVFSSVSATPSESTSFVTGSQAPHEDLRRAHLLGISSARLVNFIIRFTISGAPKSYRTPRPGPTNSAIWGAVPQHPNATFRDPGVSKTYRQLRRSRTGYRIQYTTRPRPGHIKTLRTGCSAGYDTPQDPSRDKSRYYISAFPDSTDEHVRYLTHIAKMPSTGNHFLHRGKIVDIGCARQPCIVWFNNSNTSYTEHAVHGTVGESIHTVDKLLRAGRYHVHTQCKSEAFQNDSSSWCQSRAKLDSLETWSMSDYSKPRLMFPTYKDTPSSLCATTIVQSRNLVVDDVNDNPSPVVCHVLLKTSKRRR
jgi:hypothetical protein